MMEDHYTSTCTDESIKIIVYEYIDKLEDYSFGNGVKL